MNMINKMLDNEYAGDVLFAFKYNITIIVLEGIFGLIPTRYLSLSIGYISYLVILYLLFRNKAVGMFKSFAKVSIFIISLIVSFTLIWGAILLVMDVFHLHELFPPYFYKALVGYMAAHILSLLCIFGIFAVDQFVTLILKRIKGWLRKG